MVMKIIALAVLAVLAVLVAPSHQTFPQVPVQVLPGQPLTIASKGYPTFGFVPNSSCQWNIQTLAGFRVLAVCSIDLRGPVPQCTSPGVTQRFLVAVNGNPNLAVAPYYCGTQKLSWTSQGPNLSLGYYSTALSGTVFCTLSAVR